MAVAVRESRVDWNNAPADAATYDYCRGSGALHGLKFVEPAQPQESRSLRFGKNV